MNKKITVLIASSLMLMSCATLAATEKTHDSIFTHTLSVSFKGFPDPTLFNMTYQSDALNQVKISGPTQLYSGVSSMVYINSMNSQEIFSGYPTMTFAYTTSSGRESCTLDLVDGPFTEMGYAFILPPTCVGITVGMIHQADPSYPDYFTLLITNLKR
ncbi:MAG: hypothetical protein NTU49_09350 [Gammaproteobacteria bacterium]|nr:hypothetical protein [Gammaproteobacteria bacterium]